MDLNSLGNRDLSIKALLSTGTSLKTVGATNADWKSMNPDTMPEIKICKKAKSKIIHNHCLGT